MDISPSAFSFVVGPSSAHSSSTMTLKNRSGGALAFKVLTTSKERYRVRPTSGVLAPDQTASILLILTSRDVPADITEKRDKFMVKHLACPSDVSDDAIKMLWATAAPEDVRQVKLPCIHSVDLELPAASPPGSPGGSPSLPPASDASPQQTGAEASPSPPPPPLHQETETEELDWLREAELALEHIGTKPELKPREELIKVDEATAVDLEAEPWAELAPEAVSVDKSEEQPEWLTAAESSLGLGSPAQSRSKKEPERSSSSPEASAPPRGPFVAEQPPLTRLPPSLGPSLVAAAPSAPTIDESRASVPAKLLARGLALLVPEVRDGALWCLSFGVGTAGVVLLDRADRWLCSWVFW